MLLHNKNGFSRRTEEYASVRDFCAIFHQDMDMLYWLALILTLDAAKAEQCVVAGLDDCIEGNAVFKEWARSWTKRVIIKNAIRLISPRPRSAGPRQLVPPIREPWSQVDVALTLLERLPAFERFVFVMSVLEGYADRDCATLLACSSNDVSRARLGALELLSRAATFSVTEQALRSQSIAPSALNDAEVA